MHREPPRLRLLDWNGLRFTLHWIYEGRPGLMSDRPGQVHPGAGETVTVWLLERGRVRIGGGGININVQAPQWIFLPVTGHGHTFTRGARILSVNFVVRWPDGRHLFEERLPHVAPPAAYPRLATTANRLLRLVRRRFPAARTELAVQPAELRDYLEIEAALAGWVAAYTEAMVALGCVPNRMEPEDALMLKTARLLGERRPGPPPGEMELARNAGLSVSQLNRRFVRAFGETPRVYAERLRYEAAQRYLTSTAQSVKQIAYGLGFAQPSHFAAWFRRHHGAYPSDFRRNRASRQHQVAR